MSNMNLTRYESNDELEFFIDESTGMAYASQSATARMCGVSESAIRRFVSSSQIETKKAEILTADGLRSSSLLTSESVFQAAFKYNQELALKMGSVGANLYICHQAGYQLKIETPFESIESAPPNKTQQNIEIPAKMRAFVDLAALVQSKGLDVDVAFRMVKEGKHGFDWIDDWELPKQAPTVPNDDLTAAMAKQPRTRRGRKACDRILSQYFGVYWDYKQNCWSGRIPKSDGSLMWVGTGYQTEIKAAQAVKTKMEKLGLGYPD